MNFADLPQRLFAQSHSSEHHRIGGTNIQHLWVALEDLSCTESRRGTESQEGLGENRAGCGKSHQVPSPRAVVLGLHSSTPSGALRLTAWEESGGNACQIEQNSCFLLHCFEWKLNFFSGTCMDIRRNRNATVKNHFFIVEKKALIVKGDRVLVSLFHFSKDLTEE